MDSSKHKDLNLPREGWLLFAVLAVAFILRLWGVNFGLPYLYHADEPIVVNHALAYGTGDLNPHFFKIPPLVSYLLSLCYGIYFAIGRITGFFHSARDMERLFYSDPTFFYLCARIVFGTLLGTASVFLLWRLVKRFWNPEAALWAGFFLAVNFLHVRDSHYIYPDIPLVFVSLLAFSVFFRIADGVRPPESVTGSVPVKLHFLAGGIIGLAAAVKYNGVFLTIPYLWISFRNIPWKKWPACFAPACLGAVAVFFVLNPYSILDHAYFLKEVTEQSAANQGGTVFHHLTYSLAGAMGWPMLILSVLAMLGGLVSRSCRAQTTAVYIAGYYIVLCRFGQPYDRYVLPLIPFMLIMAVELLLRIKARSIMLFGILLPFLVLPAVIKCVHWDLLMSKPDVRTIAKAWAAEHIPPGSRLALDWGFYMPRLSFSAAQLEKKREKAQSTFQSAGKLRRIEALLSQQDPRSYELHFLSKAPEGATFLFGEPLVPFDMTELRRRGIEYVFLIEALRPEEDLFFRELRNNADRVMTFSPYRNPSDLTLHDPITMTGGPFLWSDISPRERNGYPISIYRIRS